MPLLGPREAAIEAATDTLNGFQPAFEAAWLARFAEKIGIAAPRPEDRALIETLLSRMARLGADFTRVFSGLSNGTARDEFIDRDAFDAWAVGWRTRILHEPEPQAVMRAANPVRIARNHRVEQAIAAAVAGDLAPFERLAAALAAPFEARAEWADLSAVPGPGEAVARTFCGT